MIVISQPAIMRHIHRIHTFEVPCVNSFKTVQFFLIIGGKLAVAAELFENKEAQEFPLWDAELENGTDSYFAQITEIN